VRSKSSLAAVAQRAPRRGRRRVNARLDFRLRRWEAPSPTSEEFTGAALRTWRLRRENGEWRVQAQIVDGFKYCNENSTRLFSTSDEGLNR
jgi:hypothetical protein